MRSFWAAALVISGALSSAPCEAKDTDLELTISRGDLADALSSLAIQAGVSLGYVSPIPAVAVKGFHTRSSAAHALDRLLRDTPLQAERVGPATFRIVARRRITLSAPHAAIPHDIVITARKLPELLSRTPAPITAYIPGDEPGRPAQDSRAVAQKVGNLVVAGRGPGADHMFIRGVADSPFDGFSQATVAVQVDDGRITYDAAEPGLWLTDVARVEVLKGPQGPLYGTGALGGVYRIVPNRPVTGAFSGSATVGFGAITQGGPAASAEASVNLPVVSDVAALRIAAYSGVEGGWVDDRPGLQNVNQTHVAGGRVALRVTPAAGWTIDLTGWDQSLAARDSAYIYRGDDTLARPTQAHEPRSAAIRLLQGRVQGPVGRLQLTLASSQSWQSQSDTYDLAQAPGVIPIASAANYVDRRRYRVFDQELRLDSEAGARIGWTAGLSYLAASTDATGTVSTRDGAKIPFFTLTRQASELAGFADASTALLPRVRVAGGFRLFRATTEDERSDHGAPSAQARALIGFTPNLSLAYDLGTAGLLYMRFATAFRPGGLDPGNTTTGRYDADRIDDIDVGARLLSGGGRISLDMTAYLARWLDVQSDYLQSDGLLATRNAGDAGITGFEASAQWRPGGGWHLDSGITLQRARLDRGANGADLTADRRLPLIPDVAARFSVSRRILAGGIRLTPSLEANMTGTTRLSFDDGLDRKMPAYLLASAGLEMAVDALTVRLAVDNIADTRADTFALGNPFSLRATRQFTPLRPRTFSISMSRDF